MNNSFKLMVALGVVGVLGGCAVYPAAGYATYDNYGTPYGAPYGTGYAQPYVVERAPTYVYGGVTYQHRHGGPGHGGARAYRDRDGDGVPNRFDRDRDGDGVPNRRDARPNNPNRR